MTSSSPPKKEDANSSLFKLSSNAKIFESLTNLNNESHNKTTTSWADDEDDHEDNDNIKDNTSQLKTDNIESDLADDIKAATLDSVLQFGQGLDDEDYKAELEVLQNNPTSNLYSAVTFEELNLPEKLLQGIYALKYSKPSKIQSVALPMILNEPPENIIGQAQSGSGKTAAFTLGMLYRVDETLNSPQALCVAPTRELARQIMEVVIQMGKFVNITSFLAVPGNNVARGEVIKQHIVVGTPGRIETLMKTKALDTRNIRIFVLDEADYMVAEGSMRDKSISIKKNIKSRSVQFLLFSATYPDDVREFAQRMVPNSNNITVKKENLTLDGIKQYWIDCNSNEIRYSLLSDIFSLISVGKAVIFVQTRDTARDVTLKMRERGHSVGILHGSDMDRNIRDKVLDEFRAGVTKILITTNVLARGIDVLGVSLVINFDVPVTTDGQPDFETYLHRIGRTGRFGRKGMAINFIYTVQDKKILALIENHYSKNIQQLPANDLEKLEEFLNLGQN